MAEPMLDDEFRRVVAAFIVGRGDREFTEAEAEEFRVWYLAMRLTAAVLDEVLKGKFVPVNRVGEAYTFRKTDDDERRQFRRLAAK
jgi:hypothetical protein